MDAELMSLISLLVQQVEYRTISRRSSNMNCAILYNIMIYYDCICRITSKHNKALYQFAPALFLGPREILPCRSCPNHPNLLRIHGFQWPAPSQAKLHSHSLKTSATKGISSRDSGGSLAGRAMCWIFYDSDISMLTSSGNNLKWACGQQTLTMIFSKPCLKIGPLVSNGGLKRVFSISSSVPSWKWSHTHNQQTSSEQQKGVALNIFCGHSCGFQTCDRLVDPAKCHAAKA